MTQVPEAEEIEEFFETYDLDKDDQVSFEEILKADEGLRKEEEGSEDQDQARHARPPRPAAAPPRPAPHARVRARTHTHTHMYTHTLHGLKQAARTHPHNNRTPRPHPTRTHHYPTEGAPCRTRACPPPLTAVLPTVRQDADLEEE